MSQLKSESIFKCFSLLREYIAEGPGNNKKEIAMLALDHLQKITAAKSSGGAAADSNTQVDPNLSCTGRPRFIENSTR